MTAPTHIAFGVACGMLGGVEGLPLKLMAGGALLPDIDHPYSAIGRMLFFISYPLNRWVGHRRHAHSLVVWLPVTILGFVLWTPLGWIGLGAISHCFLDCWNTSGVALLLPITEKIFVLGARKYRISTGTGGEFILMVVLGLVAWSGGYIGSRGGFRAILRTVMGSYDLAVEAYQREGLKKCSLKGNLRYPSGEIVEGKWLIVGTEGKDVAVYDGERVIHIPKDGRFLKARLKIADEEKWKTVTINEPVEITRVDSGGIVFFRCGSKWGQANQGDMVVGYILHSGDVEF